MRFLIVSYAFVPSLGGQETASLALAEELARRGHAVDVVTHTPEGGTPDGSKPDLAFAVHHRPSPLKLLALHRMADAVIHNGLSMRFFWPLLLVWRRWLVIYLLPGPPALLHRLALRLFARVVAVSDYVARQLPLKSRAIPNSYRTQLFGHTNTGPRRYELAFLGRLVSDKGPMLLLQALVKLQAKGLRPSAVVIGSGQEEAALRSFAAEHDLPVEFVGAKRDGAVAELLNQARVLVVPSIWQEPFGIVALEGIACGCVVIGSSGGGLPEAIGPCGITFPNGDADALADAISRLLGDPALLQSLRDAAPVHLARHTPQAVVDAYLQVMSAD
ncbi:MAG: glycosyltransferase family 4 protein [Rhodospirillales bacterium]